MLSETTIKYTLWAEFLKVELGGWWYIQ